MNTLFWTGSFFLALAANIIAGETGNETLHYISKPLLMPLLTGLFLSGVSNKRHALSPWLLAALFFSWSGDVLLMFVPKDEMFFLLGLASFLIAHICYIFFFEKIRRTETVTIKPLLPLLAAAYYAVLITILFPHLADMKVPVLVYGVVISVMFMLAMHMLFIKNKKAGQWMMTGAALFVISDSVLAINKFYQPFEQAGLVIMLTYGLAQFFIVSGAVKYITGKQ
ncbi:MAG: lysoplasmalogenase [Chitinophagaceae bacterium]|nr:lysoplasmalogenase [Chitinophagaceae bacterium]